MRTRRIHRAALAALSASLLLAACGGGDGDDDEPALSAASASSGGFIAFIASLAKGRFDDDEPFDLSNFNAPTDDADSDPPASTPVDA